MARLDETIEAALPNSLVASNPQISTDNPLHWLNTAESVFVIMSAVAIVIATIVAWKNLRLILEQIRQNETSSRIQNTQNFLIKLQADASSQELRRRFVEIRDRGELAKLALKSETDSQIVRNQLNQYEMIAIAIDVGAMDEEMIRRLWTTTILFDWSKCWEFVAIERSRSPLFWIETERLVRRFSGD